VVSPFQISVPICPFTKSLSLFSPFVKKGFQEISPNPSFIKRGVIGGFTNTGVIGNL